MYEVNTIFECNHLHNLSARKIIGNKTFQYIKYYMRIQKGWCLGHLHVVPAGKRYH